MRGDLVLRRIGGALVTLLLASMIASMIVFALVRFAPGDPVDMALGLVSNDLGVNTEMLEERKAELRELHGLNDSVPVQYLRWLKRLAALDLGRSMRTGRPVLRELLGLIPATLLLSSAALLVESALGLSLGLYSAIKAGRFQDGLVRMMCVVMASLPAFVFSLVLLFVFSIRLRWYGISSYAGLSRLWLPALRTDRRYWSLTLCPGMCPKDIPPLPAYLPLPISRGMPCSKAKAMQALSSSGCRLTGESVSTMPAGAPASAAPSIKQAVLMDA